MLGAPSRKRATSSGLKTTGTLRGSCMNDRCLARSGRSSVTLKKNRSAETVALIFGVPAPLDARCKPEAAHLLRLCRVGGPPQKRGEVLDPVYVVMLSFWRQLADRHVFDHA